MITEKGPKINVIPPGPKSNEIMKLREKYVAKSMGILHPVVIKEAKGALLVFDVTRPETFNNIETWYKEVVQVNGDNIPIIVVGNKIDLEDQRKVSSEDGKALASKIGLSYVETSALNQDLVEEAFQTLAFLLVQGNINPK